ncbi:MAG TPA: Gfo/Idh/MocA family oxidoreductase, partial [Polyangia bacterium]|nr:Gfo/Idh/MocA family oxidoreductase [Polyangia bacterium]
MDPVGVALVGAGPGGQTLGRAMARLPEVDLRWICELEPGRRAAAAGIAAGARLTGALEEALADPRVAAAFVAVDSPRHHPVGLQVLQADRHLLVEKPLALTVADAAELSALADARGRVLAVGHLLLHHPAVRRARQLVAEGALGETLWLEAARLAPGSGRTGSAWWTLAPHDVSLALHLFDAVPARVTAVGGAGRAPGEETVVWATLHFGDGRLAHVHAARHAAEKRRGFSVVGTRRALSFDELAGGGALRVHDPSGAGAAAHGDAVPIDAADALAAQCRHFV